MGSPGSWILLMVVASVAGEYTTCQGDNCPGNYYLFMLIISSCWFFPAQHEILSKNKCREIWHLSMCVMWRMSQITHNLCCFVAIFCKISFVAKTCNLRCREIFFFLRFTPFLCGENLNQKLCLWRKMINIWYMGRGAPETSFGWHNMWIAPNTLHLTVCNDNEIFSISPVICAGSVNLTGEFGGTFNKTDQVNCILYVWQPGKVL